MSPLSHFCFADSPCLDANSTPSPPPPPPPPLPHCCVFHTGNPAKESIASDSLCILSAQLNRLLQVTDLFCKPLNCVLTGAYTVKERCAVTKSPADEDFISHPPALQNHVSYCVVLLALFKSFH